MPTLPSSRIVWVLRGLCTTALTISIYLSWVAFTKSDVAGCGGAVFDCDHVLSSKWSSWFSIPVAAGAATLYVAALATLAFCRQRAAAPSQQRAWKSFTILGIAAGLAAVWFISLQVFVIGHFCLWCLGVHACGLVIASILLWQRPIGLKPTLKLSTVSLTAVFILIGGQILTPAPPTYHVEYHDFDESGSELEFASPNSDVDDDVFEPPSFDDEDEDIFAPPVIDDEPPIESEDVAKLEN